MSENSVVETQGTNENLSTNEAPNAGAKKFKFSVKNIVRMLTLLCIVFVFCPSFLVSCSEQTVEVNVMTAVEGVKMYGEEMVEPQAHMWLCLLLPIAVMVLLFIKKLSERVTAGVIAACVAVDLVKWFDFKSKTKEIAESNGCTFETTGWYTLNLIVMFLIVVFMIAVLAKLISMETDLVAFVKSGEVKQTMSKISDAASKVAEDVSAAVKSEATSEMKPASEVKAFCGNCGTKLDPEAVFCENCGTKV